MSDEIIDIKILQITEQVDKLTRAVDKLCYRIELLESDLADRKLRKKIINFLLTVYPLMAATMMFILTLDHNNHAVDLITRSIELTQVAKN